MTSTEFVGEGADVTGEGEDFQNFKIALRAFRIGATCWVFKLLWARVAAQWFQSEFLRSKFCISVNSEPMFDFFGSFCRGLNLL